MLMKGAVVWWEGGWQAVGTRHRTQRENGKAASRYRSAGIKGRAAGGGESGRQQQGGEWQEKGEVEGKQAGHVQMAYRHPPLHVERRREERKNIAYMSTEMHACMPAHQGNFLPTQVWMSMSLSCPILSVCLSRLSCPVLSHATFLFCATPGTGMFVALPTSMSKCHVCMPYHARRRRKKMVR